MKKVRIGVIGLGAVGSRVALSCNDLGMEVIGYDPYLSHNRVLELKADIRMVENLEELWGECDFITIHTPLNQETRGMISREAISKMKDGVIIINNSRGQLIVEQDLADALNSGKVYAAGLDVLSSEPVKGDNPLLKAKNCIITPHISWAPKESRQRILDTSAANLKAYLDGRPINVVNGVD